MYRKLPTLLVLAAAAAIPAAAIAAPRVTVTRFHLAQVAPGGDIAIAPAQGGDVQSLEFQAYAAPVAAELTRLGYHVVGGPAPLVAAITVNHGLREGPPRSSGFSLGLGGFTGGGGYRGGGGVGVGGGVSFPLGGSRPTQIIGTELGVQLRDSATGGAFWEGRASDEVRGGSRDASPDVETARLARALFRDFPGESGRTITVK